MRLYKGTLDVMRPMPPFIRPLRDANREGRKSQTRRVMALPKWSANKWRDFELAEDGTPLTIDKKTGCLAQILCPYGKVGRILYMREPLFKGPFDIAHYVDDKTMAFDIMTGEPIKWEWKMDTLSQLYMPKVAMRTFFQYELIRVERLQEISEEDVIAEGVFKTPLGYYEIQLPDDHAAGYVRTTNAVGTYQVLWDAINDERDFGWRVNPWVWVLGYKPLDPRPISVINSNVKNLLIADDPIQSRDDVDAVMKAAEKMLTPSQFKKEYLNPWEVRDDDGN